MSKSPSELSLADFDVIFVNTSSGKDSQAMTDYIVTKARMEEELWGWDEGEITSRIVLAHADLGRVEWPGVVDLAYEHAAHYGVRIEKVKRPQGDLLHHARSRGMWPSPKQRYCTSDHKRGQCNKIITSLTREVKAECEDPEVKIHFLNCFGFRAEESPAREKLPQLARNTRVSNTLREVYNYLPIQEWSTDEVWARIRQAGTRWHWAYDRGMTRLSCRFCFYAPDSQIMLSALQPENEELWNEYLALEGDIDHTFKNGTALSKIAADIAEGVRPNLDDDGAWNM